MEHWDHAVQHLSLDSGLAVLLEKYPERLTATSDAFRTLANAIVGQQISVKAGDAIWNRLQAGLGIQPETLATASLDTLRSFGLSSRKAEYLQGLAQAFLTQKVQPKLWPQKSDEEVIQELISLRGIGRWTAEMLLIFHLNRPDVLPLDDIALVRAAAQHFGWPQDSDASRRLAERAQAWRPWRTVATWILWRTQDQEPVQY